MMARLLLGLVFLTCAAVAAPDTSLYEMEAPSADTTSLPPLDKMPELKQFIKAEYPAADLKAGVEGAVLLELLVTDSGRVDSAGVVKGISPGLDSAALRTVRKFEFTPASAGGTPVPVLLQYEYRFSLEDEVRRIEDFVNFQGILKEKGTRNPVPDGMVVLSYDDTTADSTLPVPWRTYMEKIGSFPGQHLEEGKLVTNSDSLGRFSFHSLPAGKVHLSFPVSGYKAGAATEMIETGKQLVVEYRLERLSYSEYEIVVYGKTEKQEVAKNTLTLTEVKRIPGFGGDAVKVVQALPGVARTSFVSGEIIVRGSASGDSRYFLDGIDIPLLFHFGGLRSTYNSDALSSVDLYSGGFNVRYGGAIAGVVEIKGRPAKSDRWHGNADVSFIDASFLAEGPIAKKWSLLTTARRSYVADVMAFALDQAGFTLPMTVVPYYWDLVTRLDYEHSRKSRMFWTAFATQDAMKFIVKQVRGGSTEISEASNQLSQDVGLKMLMYGFDTDISDRWRNELRFAYGQAVFDFSVFGFVRMDNDISGYHLRDELTWKWSDALTLRLGEDCSISPMEYTLDILSNFGPLRSTSKQWFSDVGTYAGLDYRPVPDLTITPGVRYDYYHEIGEGLPSYRLTTRYKLNPRHSIKGSIGTYNQSPEPMGQAIDSVWGNPNLPPTIGRHAVLGYEWQMTDLVHLDMQTYFNTQQDIPMQTDSMSPTGQSLRFVPQQEGRMYGLELMLRHNPSPRFFGWIAYSLARSERRTPEPYSDAGPGSDTLWDPKAWYLFESDQTHNFQIVASWKLPRNYETGFRLRYVTGNPQTPQLGFTENRYQYNAEYGGYVSLPGKPRSDRMGPFFQVDVRADKKYVFNSWVLSTYLDVQNTNYFFYNSPEFYNYNYDDSERQVIGGIIIPSIGIRVEF